MNVLSVFDGVSCGQLALQRARIGVDYQSLSTWCRSRTGQVIVCENSNANWMEFQFLSALYGVKKHTKEVVYLQG